MIATITFGDMVGGAVISAAVGFVLGVWTTIVVQRAFFRPRTGLKK